MFSSIGKHAGSGISTMNSIPEPSFAERARTLVHLGHIGSLSTLSRKQPGFPFGSLMPYALDDRGCPILLISSMAMHTHNLAADPRVSLLVTQAPTQGPDGGDPLGAARVTVVGTALPVPEPEVAGARKLYLERQPNSRHWVDFEDFSFYRLSIVDVYYVGGFGVMGWIAASDYERAEHDPLADVSHGILEHMNRDHEDSLILLAGVVAGIPARKATMTMVDRLGFHVSLTTESGMRGVRIPFVREVRSGDETRQVLVEMVRQARER